MTEVAIAHHKVGGLVFVDGQEAVEAGWTHTGCGEPLVAGPAPGTVMCPVCWVKGYVLRPSGPAPETVPGP